LDTLQKGQQPRTALPNAAISPFGNPFDKILRQIAHSEQSSSHTICRKISLSVSPSSAHVRRRRRILTFLTVWGARITGRRFVADYDDLFFFNPIPAHAGRGRAVYLEPCAAHGARRRPGDCGDQRAARPA